MEIYNKTHNSESGFALIMALIISSVVLSIGLSMLSITIKQVDLTATVRESEIAFQAASLAMDCALMTRIREDVSLATTSPASSLSFDCGNLNGSVSDSGSGNEQIYIFSRDWLNNGRAQWVKVEMYIIDNSSSSNSVTFNAPGRDYTATCSAGIFCTYIFAEGYNRSQSEITSGASFAVQRELTAEF